MNCESLQDFLDHRDLEAVGDSERRAVQSHIESCPDCAATLGVHEEFLAMRIPPVPADLEQRCLERIASLPEARASRQRVGPIVLGSFVIAAAAASIVAPRWYAANEDGRVSGDAARGDSISIESPVDSGAAAGRPASNSVSAGDDGSGDGSAPAVSTSPESFTVELTRLVQLDETPLSRDFGDWFHAALVEELRQIPGLILIEAADKVEVPSIPFDASTREFEFDRNPATWPGDYDIRLAAGAAVGEDWVGQRYTVITAEGMRGGQASDSDAMRPSVDAVPEYAAVLAAEVVESLRVSRFPADASSLASLFARYEAILTDASAAVTERTPALLAAEDLARRANDPAMTARLVDATLAYAGQIENALLDSSMFARAATGMTAAELADIRAQFADSRAGILQVLRGTGDARVIGPLSEALRYDQSEEVRRVAASILGEFADDPIARVTLEWAADFDSSAEVRESAGNYLLDDAAHIDAVFAVAHDSSLSDRERLGSIIYSERLQFVEKGMSLDEDIVEAVADLIKRSDTTIRGLALLDLNTSYRSPSFVPLYLDLLRNDPSPEVRADTLAILTEYRSLPGVITAVEKAAADDPDDIVRATASRLLEDGRP